MLFSMALKLYIVQIASYLAMTLGHFFFRNKYRAVIYARDNSSAMFASTDFLFRSDFGLCLWRNKSETASTSISAHFYYCQTVFVGFANSVKR